MDNNTGQNEFIDVCSQVVNDTLNPNFKNLLSIKLIALAESDNLDDQELAARMAERLVLEVKSATLGVFFEDVQLLNDLRLVTDRDLDCLAGSAR